MTDPIWIQKTTLPDRSGNLVTVLRGDRVDLKDMGSVVDEEERFFSEGSRNLLLRWLGKGPYEISNIGVWPCGKIMFYLRTKTSSGAGVHAHDLVYSGESSNTNRGG